MDVLIVGAGPVGLFAALSLVEQGVGVKIVDKHWRTHTHSYALALHPETLRLMDEWGLAQALIDNGHVVKKLGFYDGADHKADVDLAELKSAFPYVIVVPQSSLEWALESRLQQRGVEVLWNHEVTDFKLAGGRAVAEVTRYDKQSLGYPIARTDWVAAEQFQIVATHIVGADGYHSRVRRQLGIDCLTFGDVQFFSVMEFSARGNLAPEPRVVIDEKSTNVLWPMRGELYRWTFQIDEPSQHNPTIERLTELARDRAPWFAPEAPSVVWSSIVRFEHRLAPRFAEPNAWLAGDAAHLTGPVGVQSMNIGIREAHDVARRITEILRGANSEELVASYNAERAREWGRLLGRDGEVTLQQGADDWMGRHRHEILTCLPGSGDELEQMLNQIGMTLA
ncbi:MAG: FAD-dependent monooxygenase [Acidobacteria bacterium]|nr:FAD-dependent monooxygenase [Acidobacteriota bacterium]